MQLIKVEKTDKFPSTIVIKILKSLDLNVSNHLLKEVKNYQNKGLKNFLVDLSGIELIFSAGLGAIATLSNDVKNNQGNAIIICNKKRLHNLFQITNMKKIVTIVHNIDEAISFLNEKRN